MSGWGALVYCAVCAWGGLIYLRLVADEAEFGAACLRTAEERARLALQRRRDADTPSR